MDISASTFKVGHFSLETTCRHFKNSIEIEISRMKGWRDKAKLALRPSGKKVNEGEDSGSALTVTPKGSKLQPQANQDVKKKAPAPINDLWNEA